MRRILVGALLGSVSLACVATELEGRWEGIVRVPERPLRLIVDLSRDSAGAWSGSIVVPGLGIKGAPLSNIAADRAQLRFESRQALAEQTYGAATFEAKLAADGTLAKEMQQGGNHATFTLRRTGSAQVDAPPRSTPVAGAIEDEWRGEFELGGYPRQVTLAFVNRPEGGATARFVIVGKQKNDLPVDLVVQDGEIVRVESAATRIAFEGRLTEQGAEIAGTLELGALELPLVLRRAGGSRS
jgi:hypothetical protein